MINKLDSRCAVVRFCYHSYDYRPNWTPLSPITVTYRDDEGSAFERHRGRVPFDIEKHNSMEIARKHLIEFMGIKQQAEKFGLCSFDLKLFRLEQIDGKAENFAIVTKAQLNMELPFRSNC